MKRMIVAAGMVWVSIYGINQMLPASLPKEPQEAPHDDERAIDQSINSWGPYLPHVRPPVSHLTKSLPNLAPSGEVASSSEKIDATELNANPRKVTASDHYGGHGSSAITLSKDRSQPTSHDLKPNAKIVALDAPALNGGQVENPQIVVATENGDGKLPARHLKPNSKVAISSDPSMHIADFEPLPSSSRKAAAPSQHPRTSKVASVKDQTNSRASRRDQEERRVAEVVRHPVRSKAKGGNVGLFMFAPANF
jgi:hypothetical protein